MLFAFAVEQVETEKKEFAKSEEKSGSYDAAAQVWTGRTVEAAAPGGCTVGWLSTLAQWDGSSRCITA